MIARLLGDLDRLLARNFAALELQNDGQHGFVSRQYSQEALAVFQKRDVAAFPVFPRTMGAAMDDLSGKARYDELGLGGDRKDVGGRVKRHRPWES